MTGSVQQALPAVSDHVAYPLGQGRLCRRRLAVLEQAAAVLVDLPQDTLRLCPLSGGIVLGLLIWKRVTECSGRHMSRYAALTETYARFSFSSGFVTARIVCEKLREVCLFWYRSGVVIRCR
jgi:hypothetical protein